MVKVVSPEVMREMDRKAMEDMGVPGAVLMENAGREVAIAVKRICERMAAEKRIFKHEAKIAIFCGKGNNGGDGFVAARHLANMGFKPEVFLVAAAEEIKGDAAANYRIILNMNIPVHPVRDEKHLEIARILAKSSAAVVDAIFGTGLKGEVQGVSRKVIELINELEVPVVSVDIPSGISGRTGKVLGAAVKAEETVTMALPKLGLVIYPGAAYAGRISVADIGMPFQIIRQASAEAEVLENNAIRNFFVPYPPDAHKGTFGRVFILAGSLGFTGAAALAGLAAIRSGAGLVTVGVPESLNDILEVKLTEAMTLPLPETPERGLCITALEKALEFSARCDAVALGPGLSQQEETAEFVRQFVKQCPVPMVIDADGLNVLAKKPAAFNAPAVITPHPGEMARLLGTTADEVQQDRLKAVREAARRFGCTALLKGARTLIASSEGRLFINPTGNPGMATGGSGDVLCGMIAAFLARGMSPDQAAAAGVYIHGLAGDIAAEREGQLSMTAGDIIKYLPDAFKRLYI
ncbi:MAG: ADP-dependent NAD(P)H-hydrate dehydratase / NAD(P)H-hydrate epimerase [Tepidanaerobacteraceae bacterium]|nr:ADP-dependent NAD(P)H-hydrate dehydratase / NAD(P)H-hydrate epimerase [Tepidanaerobacteraceae bacterium]